VVGWWIVVRDGGAGGGLGGEGGLGGPTRLEAVPVGSGVISIDKPSEEEVLVRNKSGGSGKI
jgi:hypothetical protein